MSYYKLCWLSTLGMTRYTKIFYAELLTIYTERDIIGNEGTGKICLLWQRLIEFVLSASLYLVLSFVFPFFSPGRYEHLWAGCSVVLYNFSEYVFISHVASICVVFVSCKGVECFHAFLHTSCFLRADFFFMNSVVLFIDPNIFFFSLTQLENIKKEWKCYYRQSCPTY